MPFHAIATLSGNRQKTIPNRSEDQILSGVVMPFVASGVITAQWGGKTQSYQALELRIYETDYPWDKRTGALADLIKGKRNQWKRFEQKAEKLLSQNKKRIFVVMPIQGERHGSQEEQRVYKEFDDRFAIIEQVVAGFAGVAIRAFCGWVDSGDSRIGVFAIQPTGWAEASRDAEAIFAGLARSRD